MARSFQFPADVPVIETERLILRAHKPEDFVGFAANLQDPAVIKYTTGKPLSEEKAWRKFLSIAGGWAHLGYGYWAAESKEDSEFIGEVGFADFKRDLKPSIKGIPEIGWVLASRVHGKGIGSEAVKAALDWGDENLEAQKTCCIIDPENTASVRLAEKFGYKEFARTKYEDFNVILLERLRKA